jgi:hypothetical protein
MEMLCLLKTSREMRMFAAVTHLAEGPSPETFITGMKGGNVSNLHSGHTETKNIHKRTPVNFVLENLNKQ